MRGDTARGAAAAAAAASTPLGGTAAPRLAAGCGMLRVPLLHPTAPPGTFPPGKAVEEAQKTSFKLVPLPQWGWVSLHHQQEQGDREQRLVVC